MKTTSSTDKKNASAIPNKLPSPRGFSVQSKALAPTGVGQNLQSMSLVVQPKLTIGEPNDKYEQEADRVATQVVQTINSPQSVEPIVPEAVQRESVAKKGKELQMKPILQRKGTTNSEASTDLENAINSARGGGQSLDIGLQAKMGQAMGVDFSRVKVHTDERSDRLNQSIQAKAFTTGKDVFFRQGEYNPSSKGGQELIAHELTHVVQQGGSEIRCKLQSSISSSPKQVQRLFGFGKSKISKPQAGLKFSDFDGKQFRVQGMGDNQIIEEVKRTVFEDGTVEYFAVGEVRNFDGKIPHIVSYGPEARSLGNWYPNVTHINGMSVAPGSGIRSATALFNSINENIRQSLTDGGADVAVGQDVINLLYTYSPKRGGFKGDLIDCIKGKVGMNDIATERQEDLMLDAVHRSQQISISAHSRGTIKTDNAVRNVHRTLSNEYLPLMRQERGPKAMAYWRKNDPGIGLTAEDYAEVEAKRFAAVKAQRKMNEFIHLIYAGNAVEFPSKFIDIDIYVGGQDGVSIAVGSYTEAFRKVKSFIGLGGSRESKLHSVGKRRRHGFEDNYVGPVGAKIAENLGGG